jgi:hypothetical protein
MGARPDFFIVGAPKCGTTAMFDYLAAHPEVFTPRRKEPTHFAPDLDSGTRGDDRYFTRDRDAYLALFADQDGEKRVGEGSVWYLYSKVAAAEIKEFAPDARIVIMLRDPVEMVYSLHAQRLVSGAEGIESFAAALAAEPERAEGRRIPRNAFVVPGLLYREVVRYTDQVRRYLDAFGRDRVLILIYDDFAADPAAAYRQVCEFLEVDTAFAPSFERINTNTVVRSPLVRSVLRFKPAMPDWSGLAPLRKRWRALRRRILKANQRAVARPPLDAELRATLTEETRPDVESLGELVGRDLTALWRRK